MTIDRIRPPGFGIPSPTDGPSDQPASRGPQRIAQQACLAARSQAPQRPEAPNFPSAGHAGLSRKFSQNIPKPPPGGPGITRHTLKVPPRSTPGKNQPIVNFAAWPLGNQYPDGTFVASGNWNGAAALPSAPPARMQSLTKHEAQQAGYQLGAKLNGEPIDPADLHRLASANHTVYETRTQLRYGRGNIPADTQSSGGANARRTYMCYLMAEKYGLSAGAGAALAGGAGNCDQHAIINSRLQTRRLGPGEESHTVTLEADAMKALGGGSTGHSFAETSAPPRQGWRKQGSRVQSVPQLAPAVVMDSWASGPALRRQDSIYAPFASHVTCAESFNAQTGSAARAEMLNAMKAFSPGGGYHEEARLYSNINVPPFTSWPDMQLVNPRFAQAARNNLREASRLKSEIMAAGAARESYNLSVGAATRPQALNDVRYETMNLSHQARPPVQWPIDHFNLPLRPPPGADGTD